MGRPIGRYEEAGRDAYSFGSEHMRERECSARTEACAEQGERTIEQRLDAGRQFFCQRCKRLRGRLRGPIATAGERPASALSGTRGAGMTMDCDGAPPTAS